LVSIISTLYYFKLIASYTLSDNNGVEKKIPNKFYVFHYLINDRIVGRENICACKRPPTIFNFSTILDFFL
jgi:hypothetical protein